MYKCHLPTICKSIESTLKLYQLNKFILNDNIYLYAYYISIYQNTFNFSSNLLCIVLAMHYFVRLNSYEVNII